MLHFDSLPRLAGTHTHTHTHSPPSPPDSTPAPTPNTQRAPAPHQSATLSFSKTLPRNSRLRWLGKDAPTLGYQLLTVEQVLINIVNLSLFFSPPP